MSMNWCNVGCKIICWFLKAAYVTVIVLNFAIPGFMNNLARQLIAVFLIAPIIIICSICYGENNTTKDVTTEPELINCAPVIDESTPLASKVIASNYVIV